MKGNWRKAANALMAAAVAAVTAVVSAPGAAQQAESEQMTVGGVAVEPYRALFLVLTDVNVRAKPLTKSKRVGQLRKGERVETIGRPKGPWLALRAGPTVTGFVYAPALMPLIDGTLYEPIKGLVALAADGSCRYVIAFRGKTEAENQRFEFADYDVDWVCRRGARRLVFRTPMFLTEGPHQGTQKPVHQITLDLLALEAGMEEIFSTNFLWNRDKGQLRYDSVNMKKFARARPPAALPVEDLRAALVGAVNTTLAVWNPAVWEAIAKQPENR